MGDQFLHPAAARSCSWGWGDKHEDLSLPGQLPGSLINLDAVTVVQEAGSLHFGQ